jgi:hypothetical protein
VPPCCTLAWAAGRHSFPTSHPPNPPPPSPLTRTPAHTPTLTIHPTPLPPTPPVLLLPQLHCPFSPQVLQHAEHAPRLAAFAKCLQRGEIEACRACIGQLDTLLEATQRARGVMRKKVRAFMQVARSLMHYSLARSDSPHARTHACTHSLSRFLVPLGVQRRWKATPSVRRSCRPSCHTAGPASTSNHHVRWSVPTCT